MRASPATMISLGLVQRSISFATTGSGLAIHRRKLIAELTPIGTPFGMVCGRGRSAAQRGQQAGECNRAGAPGTHSAPHNRQQGAPRAMAGTCRLPCWPLPSPHLNLAGVAEAQVLARGGAREGGGGGLLVDGERLQQQVAGGGVGIAAAVDRVQAVVGWMGRAMFLPLSAPPPPLAFMLLCTASGLAGSRFCLPVVPELHQSATVGCAPDSRRTAASQRCCAAGSPATKARPAATASSTSGS